MGKDGTNYASKSSQPTENEVRELASELARELGKCEANASDLRKGAFVKIPLALWDAGFLPRLRPAELALLLAVFRLANFKREPQIHVRTAELCRVAGISRRACWSALHKLIEGRIIEHCHAGKGHQIVLRPPSSWWLSSFTGRDTIPRTERAPVLDGRY